MDLFEKVLVAGVIIVVVMLVIVFISDFIGKKVKERKQRKLGDLFDRLMLVKRYEFIENIVNKNTQKVMDKLSKKKIKKCNIFVDKCGYYYLFTKLLQELSIKENLNYKFKSRDIATCLLKSILCCGKLYSQKEDELCQIATFDINMDIAVSSVLEVITKLEGTDTKITELELRNQLYDYIRKIKEDYISDYENWVNHLLGIVDNQKTSYEDYCYEMDNVMLETIIFGVTNED